MYLMKLQQTISVVMNKWESPIMNESDDNAPHVIEFTETALFHGEFIRTLVIEPGAFNLKLWALCPYLLLSSGAMQNFWMGHYNRCAYFAEKFVTSTSGTMAEFNKIKGTIVLFYGGLSCFHRDKVSSKKVGSCHCMGLFQCVHCDCAVTYPYVHFLFRSGFHRI